MTKGTILVIEDNPDNQDLIRFLLEEAEYKVLTETNGVSGLDAARRLMPRLILLDLTLPEMDGWQVARTLKADDLTKQIPLIAITAHTLPGDRKRALDAGCDGYISKPLDIPTFVEQVETFLK